MKINIYRSIIILMMVAISLENIRLFTVLQTSIKPSHIIFIIAFLIGISRVKISQLHMLALLFFMLLPLGPFYRIVDKLEFLKSYVIYALIVLYLFFGVKLFYRKFQLNRVKYIRLLIYTICITQIIGIIQFVLMNFFNVFFLQDVFGKFQFHPSIFAMRSGFYRTYSIFHEPSVFGWVTTTGFSIIAYTKNENIFKKIEMRLLIVLCYISVMISLSASAMYIIIALIVIYKIYEKSQVKLLLWFLGAVILFYVLWGYSIALDPLKRLFSEIKLENSSGYERLNTPFQYAKRTLEIFPIFGRGIGQNGEVDVVGKIGLYNSANNSMFEIIMNMGLSSIIIIISFFKYCKKTILNNKRYALLIVNFVGILLSTGAYLSFDILVILNITIFIFKPLTNRRVMSDCYDYEIKTSVKTI